MLKAIIVDDEQMIRTGIKDAIDWKSLDIGEVFTAASGLDALEKISDEEIDIMLTDINMPNMTGLELIERVKKVKPDIKILVLTGYDFFDYAHQCLRMKVEDFFLKPADEDELVQAIRGLVERRKKEKMVAIQQKTKSRAQGIAEQLKLEKTMNDLIHNRVDIKNLNHFFDEYSFDLNKSMQIAIVVPMLSTEKEKNEEDSFKIMSIKNICIDLFDVQGRGITFEDDDGKIIIAIFGNDEFDDSLESMERLKSQLEDECDTMPKIVLGSQVTGFSQLKISYNDAIYALCSSGKRINEVILSRKTEDRLHLFNEVFDEQKRIMIANTGNIEGILKAFKDFESLLEYYNITIASIRRCCFEIASTLFFSYINDTGENADNKLNSLINSLSHADKNEAFEFTRIFITQLFSEEEDNEIILKAKQYIRDNIHDDLSVSNLASKFYVTPSYFSRLFKKVTGEGCNEYIVKKRIEKAKSLLLSTNIKVGEIATMVGYRDTNYFSLAFKKHTDMSPKQYRESARK